jgi:hypothetical protein
MLCCSGIEGISVRVVYLATSIGGTRRRADSGRLPDLELEGMCEDIRHKIYKGSGLQRVVPYVLVGVSYIAPCS